MSEFDGKVVLVTGCARARGMGRAISVAFARAGADVVATDVAAGGTRNENEEGLEEIRLGWKGLESLAGEIQGLGRRVLTLVGDVSRAADAERFVADALAQFGRIDVLVNNAAAPHGADRRLLWEVPEEAWDLVIDVNLKGTFLMSRAVIPHMLVARQRADHQHGLGVGQARHRPARRLHGVEVRRDRPHPGHGPGAGSARHHGQRDLPRQRRHEPARIDRPGASARSPSATRTPRCWLFLPPVASLVPTTSRAWRCSSRPSRATTSPVKRGTSTAGR